MKYAVEELLDQHKILILRQEGRNAAIVRRWRCRCRVVKFRDGRKLCVTKWHPGPVKRCCGIQIPTRKSPIVRNCIGQGNMVMAGALGRRAAKHLHDTVGTTMPSIAHLGDWSFRTAFYAYFKFFPQDDKYFRQIHVGMDVRMEQDSTRSRY